MGIKKCSIKDCSKPHRAKSYCQSHYVNWIKTGNPIPCIRIRHKIINGMKMCGKCMESKPIDQFLKRTDRSSGLDSICRTCNSKNHANWRKNNLQRAQFLQRRHALKNKHFIQDRINPDMLEYKLINLHTEVKYMKVTNFRPVQEVQEAAFEAAKEVAAKQIKLKTHQLTMFLISRISDAVEKGLFDTLCNVNSYDEDEIQNVLKELKNSGYNAKVERNEFDGSNRIMISWYVGSK